MIVVSFVSKSTRGKLYRSLWLASVSQSLPSAKFRSELRLSYHSHAHMHTWATDQEPLEEEWHFLNTFEGILLLPGWVHQAWEEISTRYPTQTFISCLHRLWAKANKWQYRPKVYAWFPSLHLAILHKKLLTFKIFLCHGHRSSHSSLHPSPQKGYKLLVIKNPGLYQWVIHFQPHGTPCKFWKVLMW